ncbi:MAG: VOC family protein, partial [Opitutaceae bacterium]
VVNNGTIRLTHLDAGAVHLQLVEPLTASHPLQEWLKQHGAGLHHVCFKVDDVGAALADFPEMGLPTAAAVHQGTQGKRALFLDRAATQGVLVEVTGR